MHHTPLQSHGALGVEVVQLVRALWGSTNTALMARSAVISPWTSWPPTTTTPALTLNSNRSVRTTSCCRRRRCRASALLAPIPKGCPCRSPLSRRLPHHPTCPHGLITNAKLNPSNYPTSICAHHQRPPKKLQPGLEPLSNIPKLDLGLSSCFLPLSQ